MIPLIPDRLTKRITDIGGKADNGLPLFRVMRGCDRFTWIGGNWPNFDEHHNVIGHVVEMRYVLKYPEAKDRYIFEVLCPPDNYGTPETWEKKHTKWIDGEPIPELGAFPREGEYEIVKVIKTPQKGAFVPLTEAICDALVTTAKLNRELPARVRIEARKKQREKEEKAKDDRLIDKINDMAPAFASKSFIVVPDSKEIRKYA